VSKVEGVVGEEPVEVRVLSGACEKPHIRRVVVARLLAELA
jgi:hypothetical protein